MKFFHTYYLFSLLLIPVFVLLYALLLKWKKKAYRSFGESSVISQLMPDVSTARPLLKFIIMMTALAFIIIAIARPQTGSKLDKVKRKGVDLMLLLDVSNSMLAEDIKPSRLVRAKQAISKLIDRLENDRIGLIVFAGKPYNQLPITTDFAAAKLFLTTVSTEMVPTQGTAIGAAIEMAQKSFNFKDKVRNKAIIIITDGENHEDDAVEATKSAAENGVYVHTIGMGLPDGAPIPILNKAGIATGFKQDAEGNTIVTKLDEQSLQEIASVGKGTYVRASNTDVGLNKIMDEIDKMEKKEYEAKTFSDYEDQFQYFVAFALILLIAEIFISERRSKWFRKLDIFGEKKSRKM
ncbi:MAG: VWA domain-containing protein [Bacteroidetes bacterium]|nr:VWA domain-containing protein [Bacteroidota bacterium]